MAHEDSTNLSVTGEEGHSTILSAHYIFVFLFRTNLLSNADCSVKLHKNA